MSQVVQNLKIKNVDELTNFVTNADRNDIRSNIATDMRGALIGRPGIIAERDFGTIHRHDTYPTTGILNYGFTFLDGKHLRDSQNGYIYEIVAGYYDDGPDTLLNYYVRRDDDGSVGTFTHIIEMYQGEIGEIGNGSWIGIKLKHSHAAPPTPTSFDIFGNTVDLHTEAAPELDGWHVYNATRGSWAYIIDNGVDSGHRYYKTHCLPSAFGNWAVDDKVYFLKNPSIWDLIKPTSAGTTGQFNKPSGLIIPTDTHFDWIKNEDQGKVLVLRHSPATPGTRHTPVRIIRTNEETAFFNDLDYIRMDGWDAYRSQADTTLVTRGSKTDPIITGAATDDLGNGIKIGLSFFPQVDAEYTLTQRFIICPVYYGYIEGDPIYRAYVGKATINVRIIIGAFINFGQLDPAITGLRLYRATIPEGSSQADWLDDYDAYYEEVQSDGSMWFDFEKVWTKDTSQVFSMTKYYASDPTPYMIGIGAGWATYTGASLYAMLNRVPDFDRSYAQPKYGTQMSQSLGLVNVVDIDDRTIGFSSYSGTGAHQDECWPDVTIDNAGSKLRQTLNGSGPIYGLGFTNNNVVIFRQASIEITDIVLGAPRTYPADCVSRKAIVETPFGICWAGESGIYIMKNDGSLPRLLNESWQNLYDGRILNNDEDASRVLPEYRRAAIFGYNPLYQELWVHMRVDQKTGGTASNEYLNFRYNFNLQRWWSIRTLNVGSSSPAGQVTWFDDHPNRFLTIGYAHGALTNRGILKYPNQSGSYYHQDDAPATPGEGKAITFYVVANFGELYDLINRMVLYDYMPDFEGLSSDGVSRMECFLYQDDRKSYFDDKTMQVDLPPNFLRIPRVGKLDRLFIKFSIPTADADTVKRLEIKKLALRFLERSVNVVNY